MTHLSAKKYQIVTYRSYQLCVSTTSALETLYTEQKRGLSSGQVEGELKKKNRRYRICRVWYQKS